MGVGAFFYMATQTNMQRDGGYAPIQSNDSMLALKSVTFAALTTGSAAAHDLFTVTGDVLVRVFAVCSADLTSGGAATIEVGIAGNTAALIAQTTATGIDQGEIWVDNAAATVEALPATQILTEGSDVIYTVGTTTVTGGTMTFYCLWRPLSVGSSVVAA